jgi:hypothetical protein
LLLSRNVHPKYVQELLGHVSISQTLDTYSHIIEGMDGGVTDAYNFRISVKALPTRDQGGRATPPVNPP